MQGAALTGLHWLALKRLLHGIKSAILRRPVKNFGCFFALRDGFHIEAFVHTSAGGSHRLWPWIYLALKTKQLTLGLYNSGAGNFLRRFLAEPLDGKTYYPLNPQGCFTGIRCSIVRSLHITNPRTLHKTHIPKFTLEGPGIWRGLLSGTSGNGPQHNRCDRQTGSLKCCKLDKKTWRQEEKNRQNDPSPFWERPRLG